MRYVDRDQLGTLLRDRLPGCHVGVGRPGDDSVTIRLGEGRIVVAGDAVVVSDGGEVLARAGLGRRRAGWIEGLADRLVTLATRHLGAVEEPNP